MEKQILKIIFDIGTLLISGFVGAILSLYLESKKKPKLLIEAGDEADSDNSYPLGHPKYGERWKFFRLKITNSKMEGLMSLITDRETAQNCSAKICFYDLRGILQFSFNGRWASTPEIPFTGPLAAMKIAYPDPVTIPVGLFEYLDIFTQKDGEKVAYGWNAESYANNWKNQAYELKPGKYNLVVIIQTQNGVSFNKKFMVKISKNIESSDISEIN